MEADKTGLALEILELAKQKGVKFLLPVDNIETVEIKAGTTTARNTGRLSPEPWHRRRLRGRGHW